MSVINKVSEASCCGCGACVAVCQRHCLQMKQDNNGWFRPLLSLRACNECGLCESVCPVLAPKTLREQSENVFAAKAKSKSIRIKSSSGGVFATLANHIIEQQGVVCAARFASPTRLIHDFCSKKRRPAGLYGFKISSIRYVGLLFEDKKLPPARRESTLCGNTLPSHGTQTLPQKNISRTYHNGNSLPRSAFSKGLAKLP